MPKKLAVDVVLLPPPEVMARIISLTAHLPPDPTRLNTRDCLPHLSLVQGVLAEEKLSEADSLLRAVSARNMQLGLTLSEVHTYKTPDSRLFSMLSANRTDELFGLHLDVMNTFGPLLAPDEVTLSMFASPPEVAEISTHWVSTFYDKQAIENYRPHITLGAGSVSRLDAPIAFTATRLALCHLGTYCTCRNILAEALLHQ